MPEPLAIEDLGLPDGSAYHLLLARCPDIELRRYADGEYLMREGETSHEVFLVIRGAGVAEVRASEEGRHPGDDVTHIPATPDAPSFMGVVTYLGTEYRKASVRSSGTSDTMVLRKAHLDVIVAEFPALTRVLCKQFTVHLETSLGIIKDYQKMRHMKTTPVVKEPGEKLFTRGERADSLYQLLDGQLVQESDNGEVTLSSRDLYEGLVEPAPFFLNGTRKSRVAAKTRATLLRIADDSILAVIRRYPALLLELHRAAAAETS